MLADQHSVVAQLETTLSHRIVGQPRACRVISDRVRAFAAKLEDPVRPIGVFLLVGPSGVGKTETAHALADAFFGSDGLTVINMSEYQEAHTVSKLKGAPAGYVGFGQGGVLTESVRRRPYGLLLLDEVEKAHPDVLNLFLQVFDKGFMEDAEGVHIDFRNTLVILTSNAGDEILGAAGADCAPAAEQFHERELQRSLLDTFPPAFLGRTQVVPYFPLSDTGLRQIVSLKFKTIADRFARSHAHRLTFDAAVVETVVARCASEVIGARWIDQFISENILSRLSIHVLGQMAAGAEIGDVRVGMEEEQIYVEPVAQE
jgi:type VI secretion system protein VasG